VGTGKARSFNDLAASVYKAVKEKSLDFKDESQIQYIPMPENLQMAYQDFTEAKMDKLKRAGYTKPFTSLEEGVGVYVKDFLMKEDIYL
jgi:ADP-L-glycero-D-manno-heptose 6-epimerase